VAYPIATPPASSPRPQPPFPSGEFPSRPIFLKRRDSHCRNNTGTHALEDGFAPTRFARTTIIRGVRPECRGRNSSNDRS